MTAEELAAMLMNALTSGDEAMMAAVARQAVARYAGMEPGRPVGGTYYLYRTLRNLDLDAVLEQLVSGRRPGGGDGTTDTGGDAGPPAEPTTRDDEDDFESARSLYLQYLPPEISSTPDDSREVGLYPPANRPRPRSKPPA